MNKIVLIPIIIALIIYFAIFQTIPSVQAVLQLRKDRDTRNIEVQKEQGKLDNLTAFKKGVSSHQNELNFVSNFIPKDPIENDIVNILNQKAEDTKVSLFIVDFTDKIPRKSRKDSTAVVVNTSETNIILTGSYENIKKFLNEIYLINRMYSLDTLVIEKIVASNSLTGESEGATDSLNVNITFNYSYIPENLSMKPSDANGIIDKVKDNYDFVKFVEKSSAKLRAFEVANPSRQNPFSPN